MSDGTFLFLYVSNLGGGRDKWTKFLYVTSTKRKGSACKIVWADCEVMVERLSVFDLNNFEIYARLKTLLAG